MPYPDLSTLSQLVQQEASKEEAAEEHLLFLGGVHESLPDLMIDAKKTVLPCVSGRDRSSNPLGRKMSFRPMFLLQKEK